MLLSVFASVLSSCSNDDDKPTEEKPVITMTEVGTGDNKEAVAGQYLHLEGNIEAESLIARIDFALTTKDGKTSVLDKSWTDGAYIGVRNAEFHEHVDIPDTVEAGDYTMTLTVTDKAGLQSAFTSNINIVGPDILVEDLKVGEFDNPESGIVYAYGHLSLQAKISLREGTVQSIKISASQDRAGSDGTLGKFDETDVTSYYDKQTGLLKAVVPEAGEYTQIPMDQPVGTYTLKLIITLQDGKTKTLEKQFEVSDKPFIEGFEVGSGHGAGELNNHTGSLKVGDLHIAGIFYCVWNRFKSAKMTITSKVDNKVLMTQTWDESTGYFGAMYGGARNVHFHEHPVFPKDTKPGDYKFRFVVEDLEGQTCVRESDLKIVAE